MYWNDLYVGYFPQWEMEMNFIVGYDGCLKGERSWIAIEGSPRYELGQENFWQPQIEAKKSTKESQFKPNILDCHNWC